ncbi:anthranilate synthase component I family protein [Rhodopirellula halodulae]|uniref:anthranilate synthase component I family protein n=1 Tax=Rhodopirellula halodulae TaxID=2894198 RepID=UPI0021030FD4
MWIESLGRTLELEDCFHRLAGMKHRLWFDSVSDRQHNRGRYSFFTADPVGWLHKTIDQTDSWPELHRWCSRLPSHGIVANAELAQTQSIELPPFCGGLAGLIGYEAAWWLEPSVRMPADFSAEHPTTGMAIGIYDWTIAVDHVTGQTLLICNGLNAKLESNLGRAKQRAHTIRQWLEQKPDQEPRSRASLTSASSLMPSQEASKSCPSPTLKSNFTEEGYRNAVAEIIARIRAGDSFQVNLSQALTHPATCSAAELYQRLRQTNPAPYACFLDLGCEQILSSSPEGFLQVRDRKVVTRPIKGTVPRTGDDIEDERLAQVLGGSAKDRAENIMIVDLMRNDLSIVCEDSSVRVTGLCELERYQSVQHLVSTVEGQLRNGVAISELLAACFPGGSITGAPKIEAMKTIARLEGQPRGAYCGSMGYISVTGNADFNILIRTVTQREGQWHFPVGGGITSRSDPQNELDETWTKAQGMLRAIQATTSDEPRN